MLEDEHEIYAKYLTDQLLTRLEGSHPSLKSFQEEQQPSKSRFLIGTLAEIKEDSNIPPTMVETNSISVSFLYNSTKDIKLRIKPNFSLYYPVFPTWDHVQKELEKKEIDEKEVKIEKFWKRIEFDENNVIEIDVPSSQENHIMENIPIDGLIKKIYSDPLLYVAPDRNKTYKVKIVTNGR